MTAPGPGPDWAPANEVEEQLFAALAADDRRRYFQILATAPLYLPAPPPASVRSDDPAAMPYFTWNVLDGTYLLAFTSVQAMTAALGPGVQWYSETDYAQLSGNWPAPAWRLAVNPGQPIDAWLPVDMLAAAARGTVAVPTVAEMLESAEVRGDPDRKAAIGAVDGYLTVLLRADVYLPAAAPTTPDALAGGGFPWRPTDLDGRPTVVVYTAAERLAADTSHVRVPFAAVVAAWPDPSWQLAVDPGTETALTLPGADVPDLLLWARATPPS